MNPYSEFFQDIVLDFWRAAVQSSDTMAEARFLVRVLMLEPGATVLDVPCGNGRHSLALARLGHLPTGIDIAADFIREARAAKRRRAPDGRVV